MSKGNPIVGIRLPKETLARLKKLSEDRDNAPISAFAREALDAWLAVQPEFQ